MVSVAVTLLWGEGRRDRQILMICWPGSIVEPRSATSQWEAVREKGADRLRETPDIDLCQEYLYMHAYKLGFGGIDCGNACVYNVQRHGFYPL